MSTPGGQVRGGGSPAVGEDTVDVLPTPAELVPEEAAAGGGGGAVTLLDSPRTPDATAAASAAGDSLTVAAGTMVSRITGLARFAVVGAVLGPTFTGSTYQFTNSMPNLVYYGFLGGALFSSLLVPSLVRHLDAGDRRAMGRIAGGFLGITLTVMVVITPLAYVLGPLALKTAALGGPHAVSAAEVSVGRLLILMLIPQMFLYAVIGTSTAVMNAHRRFALAATAPAVENLGTITVLLVTGAVYGTGRSITNLPMGEILLLGLGSTGAVMLHAAIQWWGARRAGVALRPALGWRDAEVLAVARRAVPALTQTGLDAFQLLVLLIAANRLPGGIVAFQIALSFYFVSNALGIAPVALSLLPRLSRMHLDGDTTAFRDTLARGFALGFFVTIPAGVAYLVLAVPLARAVSFGQMDSGAGVAMLAGTLAALSVAVVAQTAFLIATYASYARKDTRSPLRSMVVQTITCLALVSLSLLVHGTAILIVLGLAVSGGAAAAACHLMVRMRRTLGGRGTVRLTPSLLRFIAGAVIMAGPAWLSAAAVTRWAGPKVGMIAAALVGVTVYVTVERLWRTPEVEWLSGGLGEALGGARRALAERGAGLLTLPTIIMPPPAQRPGGYLGNGHGPRRPAGRRVIAPTLLVAAAAGALTTLGPLKALGALLVLAIMACIWRWPVLAAYLAIGLTPLTTGLSLGHALPLIRPNEAIDLLAGGTLAVRGIVRARTGLLPRIRMNRIELAIVAMAVCNSVLPLLWMTVRREAISTDDILYALVMWKLLAIYIIVRAAVRTDGQVRSCLWLFVGVVSVVALVAVVQSAGLFGVPAFLARNFGAASQSGPGGGRGSSTLGLPGATADLMVFGLAAVTGLWLRYRRHRLALAAAAALMIAGTLAAGEFSGAIGLVVGVICIAVVTGSPRLIAYFSLAGLIGAFVTAPIIDKRLSGFSSTSGLPESWVVRLQNLQTYFWPKLFSDWNFILGVRPAARVIVPGGYVWIESGYTWLLWGGGIPLLVSFLYFIGVTAKAAWRAAQREPGARSVAGATVFVAVIVIAVLMLFDPHLTYRGSADEFFFMIALMTPPGRPDRQPRAGQHLATEWATTEVTCQPITPAAAAMGTARGSRTLTPLGGQRGGP
jgi:peptidoglycan biosynthesis protein MviN/MurJ (putative lipid II flippase)